MSLIKIPLKKRGKLPLTIKLNWLTFVMKQVFLRNFFLDRIETEVEIFFM